VTVDGQERRIPAGDLREWDYSLSFIPVEDVVYRNVVSVTLANHLEGEYTYSHRDDFKLPDTPTSEEDACATVTDIQDMPTGFSTTDDYPADGWYTCVSNIFTVHKTVTNHSAAPGAYTLDNIATLTKEDTGAFDKDHATVAISAPKPEPPSLLDALIDMLEQMPGEVLASVVIAVVSLVVQLLYGRSFIGIRYGPFWGYFWFGSLLAGITLTVVLVPAGILAPRFSWLAVAGSILLALTSPVLRQLDRLTLSWLNVASVDEIANLPPFLGHDGLAELTVGERERGGGYQDFKRLRAVLSVGDEKFEWIVVAIADRSMQLHIDRLGLHVEALKERWRSTRNRVRSELGRFFRVAKESGRNLWRSFKAWWRSRVT
jgi:hypothetical protein